MTSATHNGFIFFNFTHRSVVLLVFLNLNKVLSLPLSTFTLLLSIIMTISSTLLALVLMPLCLWIYSRAWINTPVVNLMPFGAIILTLCSTLIPIGLGVLLRYRYTRVADIVLKVILRIFCSQYLSKSVEPFRRAGAALGSGALLCKIALRIFLLVIY